MTQAPADIESWLALSLIPGLGAESQRKLLQAFGSPANIFAASHGSLKNLVHETAAQAIRQGPRQEAISATLDWLQDPINAVITLADPDYPRALLEISDPPPLFYLKGRRELLGKPAIAVVGSRNATPQGTRNAEAFARVLSDSGLCIVSGLALGIDAAAHRGGLQGASGSIAVVGTGLDIIYPARNRALAHELADRGALISEFPLGTPSIGSNFPRRNRIISGLSAGCLVVEAAPQSGSLITARLAAEQGREVFAIPGSIHSPVARGCHALIKQGAKLVESAQDILEELGWGAAAAQARSDMPTQEASGADIELLRGLGFEPTDMDTLALRTGLTTERVSAMLLQLELDGRVASLPGGFYQRIN
jgi:DNA processing protein